MLPLAPAGRGLTPDPEAPPRHRKVVGAQRLCRDPADAVPAGRRVRPVGPARRRSAPARPRRCSTRWSPTVPQLATTLLPGLLEALGRNVSRGAVDVGAVRDRPSRGADPETRAVERIPNDRRPTDDEIATLDASLPRQPQHVGVVLAGLREPAGPWGPGRPVQASDAFEAVRVIGRAAGVELTLRAAQYLPWHPGRCAEVLVGDTGRRPRRPTASRGRRAVRACRRAPARSSWTWTPSRSPRRCPRRRCRRSRRSSRTSA